MTKDLNQKKKLMSRATTMSVSAAVFMLLLKLSAWIITGSVALLSSMIDSFLDAATSIINKYAISKSLAPADEDFGFGYGKAEPLAGLVQAAFIAGSVMFVVVQTIEQIYSREPLEKELYGIIVMVISTLVTIALVMYQFHVVKKTNSVAIKADSVHYTGDILTNLGVIFSLVLNRFFPVLWLDIAVAVAIVVYLSFNAFDIAKASVELLMDKEFPIEDRNKIKDIVSSFEDVRNIHDLRTRHSGLFSFIQMHIVFDGDMTLEHVHHIGDGVAAAIREEFPEADIMIHHDPSENA